MTDAEGNDRTESQGDYNAADKGGKGVLEVVLV